MRKIISADTAMDTIIRVRLFLSYFNGCTILLEQKQLYGMSFKCIVEN